MHDDRLPSRETGSRLATGGTTHVISREQVDEESCLSRFCGADFVIGTGRVQGTRGASENRKMKKREDKNEKTENENFLAKCQKRNENIISNIIIS